MSIVPGEILPWIEMRFLTADGTAPLSLGSLLTYQAGTSTPLATYADSSLVTANPTTIALDAGGRPTVDVYLAATGYKFVVEDAGGSTVYTYDNVENVGQVFSQTFGTVLSTGAKAETSGYTVLSTDRLVTVDGTGGANPCVINLPAVSSATSPVGIKNLSTSIPVSVTPNGSDLIELTNSAYSIPAASGTTYPGIWLVPYPTLSAWYILASHGI